MSTPEAEAELRQCWQRLASGAHEFTLQQVVARYAEPHRRYHTAVHVMWVLRHIDDLLPSEPGVEDADAVRAAGLFHDIVYDPRSSTNERDSAAIAIETLGDLGWSSNRLVAVRDLIAATVHHEATSAGSRVLNDADLAVLGAAPGAYRAYADSVRAEYGHVADTAWREGRSAVLRAFLARDRIFATDAMWHQRERRARANLAAELAGLGELVGPGE